MNKKSDKTLLERARELVDHIKRTREHSVSAVYGIYNEITGKNETPSTCGSCLESRAKAIERWVVEEESKAPVPEETVTEEEEEVKPKKKK